MKYYKVCPICCKEYTTYRKMQKTCSKVCMGKYQTGKNNPNYRNKWTSKQKAVLSNYQKSIGDQISKRVKKDWEDNTERKTQAAKVMAKTVKELYKTKPELWSKPVSEATKQLIGKKSKLKFTKEFLQKQRETMEILGYWRPLNQVPAYELYFKEAEWVAGMWDLVDSSLLAEHGVFNKHTNPKGCVRDHMLGRREGFRLGVPAILLRHPANCQVVTHSDNIKKSMQGDITKSLEQLIKDIQEYTKEWKEQQQCLQEITAYQQKQEAFHECILHK